MTTCLLAHQISKHQMEKDAKQLALIAIGNMRDIWPNIIRKLRVAKAKRRKSSVLYQLPRKKRSKEVLPRKKRDKSIATPKKRANKSIDKATDPPPSPNAKDALRDVATPLRRRLPKKTAEIGCLPPAD